MDKSWYKSKTILGFGLLIAAGLGQEFGILPENLILETIKAALTILGIVGIRDILD